MSDFKDLNYRPGTIGLKYIQEVRKKIQNANLFFVESRKDEDKINAEIIKRLKTINEELKKDGYNSQKRTEMLQVYEKLFYASYYQNPSGELRKIGFFSLIDYQAYLFQMDDMKKLINNERTKKNDGESIKKQDVLYGDCSYNEKSEVDTKNSIINYSPEYDNECIIFCRDNYHFIGIKIVKTPEGKTKFIISDSLSRGQEYSSCIKDILTNIYQNAKISLKNIEIEVKNVRSNGNNDCAVHSVFNNIFSSKNDKTLYQGSFDDACKHFKIQLPKVTYKDSEKLGFPHINCAPLSEDEKNKLIKLFNETGEITFQTNPPISFCLGKGSINEHEVIKDVTSFNEMNFIATNGKSYMIYFDEKGSVTLLGDNYLSSFAVSSITQKPIFNSQSFKNPPKIPSNQSQTQIPPLKAKEEEYREHNLLRIFGENKFVKIDTLNENGERVVVEFNMDDNNFKNEKLNTLLKDTDGNYYNLNYSGDSCSLFKEDFSELFFNFTNINVIPKPIISYPQPSFLSKDKDRIVNSSYMEVPMSHFPVNTIKQSPYIDKVENRKNRKIEKRTISSDRATLGLEFRDVPDVEVDISFETENGKCLTLKKAFTKLMKKNNNLQETKKEMQNILSVTLSNMESTKKQEIADGFGTNVDRIIAEKITNQILKELGYKKEERKPITLELQ